MRKRRKRLRGSFFSFLLIGILLIPGGIVQAEDRSEKPEGKNGNAKIIREMEYTSRDPDEERPFKEKLREQGKTYPLERVDYTITEETPVMVDQEVTKEVESDPIPEGQAFEPAPALEEDGLEFRLIEVREKGPAETTVTQKVQAYTDYDWAVSQADVPEEKKISAKNEVTGEAMDVTCRLTGIEAIADPSWEDTYIDIVFQEYDAFVFQWESVTVSKDTQTPLAGYEEQLIRSVGASPEDYRVLRTYWAGEPYTNTDGVLCRNARADVQRKIVWYRANYAAEVPITIREGTVYEAVYQGTSQVEDPEQRIYTIHAKAVYRQQIEETEPEDAGIPKVVLGIGIGLMLLALLTAAVLFWIWKNKKNNGKEEEING